jgi:hypothetical protein
MTTQKYPHGKLTVGDSVLVGTMRYSSPTGVDFRIDGAEQTISVFGPYWKFEPDPPQLPTEPGVYVRESELASPDPDLYLLRPDGTWFMYWAYFVPEVRKASDIIDGIHGTELRPISEWSPRA